MPITDHKINGLSEVAIYKSLLASANFTDFVTVDDGASAHDAHLDAALADYDDEFTSLQLQTGQLDPVSSGVAAAAVGGGWCGSGGGGRGSGSPGPLLNKEKFRNLGVNLSWPRHQTWLPKVYPNRPKTETWA